ncbi:hypothetical protein BB558_005861 [Smittium angustum]|uniref:Chitin-binding type-4 domain-containing protein n=1 Tax=Smittium angustum TaxID=133377 RepID=A0A2U1IZ94_SMIAN|nr:hypothetical protein BB558_005861 [Smittium angustum]
MLLNFLLLITFALLSSVYGHGQLLLPTPRGNKEWYGTCAAGAGCKGPCDSSKANSPYSTGFASISSVQRGQNLTVKWNRLNHPGGFIRIAMTSFENSDDWNSFNNNVVKYTCYETNCGPADPNDNTFGPLAGPGNEVCSTTITIPENLQDGVNTLQWMWYGGGIYYGETDTSFGEYYGCSDMQVTGGPKSETKQEPTFQGGDVMYPNENVCRFWGSSKVGDCSFPNQYPTPKDGDLLSQSLEPCTRGPPLKGTPADFTGLQSAVPQSNDTNRLEIVPEVSLQGTESVNNDSSSNSTDIDTVSIGGFDIAEIDTSSIQIFSADTPTPIEFLVNTVGQPAKDVQRQL